MTQAMKLMANEFIKRDFSIGEIIEIMQALSFVLNDRKRRDNLIKIRFLEDDAEERMKYDEKIKWAEDSEIEDIYDAEAVLRKYELKYDVDELLGNESI